MKNAVVLASPIMTDAEVAAYFRISTYTLQKRMRDGFPKGETDLNAAEPERIAGRRWWYRPKVEALANGRRA